MAQVSNPIERIAVAEDRFDELWGVKAYDYNYNKVHVDLQDMLVAITQKRAASIEDEVKPLQEIITRRNKRLENYGIVLQKLTELQAKYTGSKTSGEDVDIGSVINDEFSESDFWAIMGELGVKGSGSTLSMAKSSCEGTLSRCKNVIDGMNNDSQKDMTRLQSVVDRRDESYSTATTLMTAVSDTRGNLIKNM